jgi:hypothetical protein
VVVAALAILASAPLWAWVAVAAATGPLLARAGRPAHKPIVTAATLPGTVQAPSQDVITRALGSLGMAGIDRWLRDGRELVFPFPVRADHAPEGGRAYRPPQSGEAVAPSAALVGRDGAAGLGAAVIVIGAYLVGESGR